MNKKIIRDSLILFAFTLVLGLVLAFVYSVTKAPIEAANYAAQQAAYQAVFSNAASFEAYDGYDKESANALVGAAGYSDTIDDVQLATDASGNLLGYVITVTAKDGSQGSITFSVGITVDGVINGYSITDTSETPGLGLKASEDEFAGQFAGINIADFVNSVLTVTKGESAGVGDIEAITGSTITSKAVANGCNAAILYFTEELGGAE